MSNTGNSKVNYLQDDVLEAIATLTDLTIGDIYHKIQAGEFTELAVEALKAFTKNFHLFEKNENSEPVDDSEILKQCLLDLMEELKLAEGSRSDPQSINDLKQDIDDLNRRINLEA